VPKKLEAMPGSWCASSITVSAACGSMPSIASDSRLRAIELR